MSNFYRGPSKDASYQISVHLAKRFQRRFFRNQPIRNKNGLWQPYLLTDRNELSNLYRGPAIVASYQVSVHLAKWFRRRFEKSANQKQELPVAAMFVNRSDKMSNFNRGSSIDASYQIQFIWLRVFRGEDLKKIGQSETRMACGSHVC